MIQAKKAYVFLLLILFPVSVFGEDVYISFSGFSQDISVGYLMKIDEMGHVLKEATVVLPPSVCRASCLASLSDDGAGRIIYFVSRASDENDDFADYGRALVNKETFHSTRIKNLGIALSSTTFPASSQITQNTAKKFAVLEVGNNSARAFTLTETGLLTGEKWRVNPAVSAGYVSLVGVAPDGLMSWAINGNLTSFADKIFLQALKPSGRPTGDPVVSGKGGLFNSADLSNPLANGKRLLVYEELHLSNPISSTIYIQAVDAVTGSKSGAPITLNARTPSAGFVKGLAVDPKGRFLLYIARPADCFGNSLFFQALDALGNPSGRRKELFGCKDFSGDILQVLFVDVLLDEH